MKTRIFLSPPHMSGEELNFIQEVFATNYIAPVGPMLDAFEREFTEKVGISHAVALSSGTAAMHLALINCGVERGDTVIAPSMTFIGGVSPILFQGAIPVFIDSDRKSWNIDPELLKEEIRICNKEGNLPKAVITTDIYGQCADMDRIVSVCLEYNIPVISDSAEALGATYKECSAGKGAKAAIYSFNGNKIITTSSGGMLVSDDRKFIERARFLAHQAKDTASHYEHSQIGYNYRMSNVLAAIGLGQLEVLDDRVKRCREIFDMYIEGLKGIEGIELMPEASYGTSNRWLTVILIEPDEFGATTEEVRIHLESKNIESRPVWKPMHMQPLFKDCRVRGGGVCEDFFERGLCLPSGTQMTENDIYRVVSSMLELYKK